MPLNVERRWGEKEEKETETTQSTRADQQRSDGSTEKGEPFMMSLTATMPVIVTVTLTLTESFVTTNGKAKTSNGQMDRLRKESHL